MKYGFKRKSDGKYLCHHRAGDTLWTLYRHPGFPLLIIDSSSVAEELSKLRGTSADDAVVGAMIVETHIGESPDNIELVDGDAIVLRSLAR